MKDAVVAWLIETRKGRVFNLNHGTIQDLLYTWVWKDRQV